MPYISVRRAEYLRKNGFDSDIPTAGDLTWAISETVAEYLRARGTSFQACSDVLGSLEATEQEFTRRVLTPYERGKAAESNRDDPFRGLAPEPKANM